MKIIKLLLCLFFFSLSFSPLATYSQTPTKAPDDSPFEDASAFGPEMRQQEQDEVFFETSRFVSLGALAGMRFFTQGLGEIINSGFNYGGYLDYFFSQNWVGEGEVTHSIHKYSLATDAGYLNVIGLIMRLKYYFTSEAFTKALAYVNPHLFVGGSRFFITGVGSNLREEGFGTDFGCGLELPIKEKTVYAGMRFAYHWVFLGSENEVLDGTKLNGDLVSFLVSISYNF